MTHANPTRILCVDDNQDVANSAADLLQLLGYEARACYDGRSALALAGLFGPDVCMLDLNMPGMDGDELAVRLREQAEGVLLVAVTAMGDEASRRRIATAGFDLHLVKPVNPRLLSTVIESLTAPAEGAGP